ncbi:MAG: DNA adenine methylase, partial [Eubacteriales bacterium]|nr:DNA adenine methylase [Eubacteriales bacterium]
MGKYGIPYKGCKQKIADQILSVLPPAENFYDLFAGGGAITHCAMLSEKYENYIMNDIEPGLCQLFRDAVSGKYHDEKGWVSRQDFELLKHTSAYVRFIWSFGNNGRKYMYSPEIERFKKHLHHIFFAENPHDARMYWKAFVREFAKVREEIAELTKQVEKLCDDCGVEMLRNVDGTVNAKKIKKDVNTVLSGKIRKYMRDCLKESGRTAADVDRLLGTNGMAGHYFGESQWALPTKEAYEKMQTILPDLTIPWGTLNESL